MLLMIALDVAFMRETVALVADVVEATTSK
jgi:hypothetical protein